LALSISTNARAVKEGKNRVGKKGVGPSFFTLLKGRKKRKMRMSDSAFSNF
jgi:shikimate kinase